MSDGQQGAGKCADTHESRMPKRELAGKAGDQVQSQGQYDADADID